MKRNTALGFFSLVLGAAIGPLTAAEVDTTKAITTPAESSESTPLELSGVDLARARRWGLNAAEWQRFQSLMTGIRGSLSPANLSPVEVLGIHARSEGERRQYAEQWARLMHEDVERVLAFQRAYDDASRRLYGNEPLISTAPDSQVGDASLARTDRLLVFVAPDCAPCDAALKNALRLQSQIAGIDVYLVGLDPKAPAAVQTWAASHGISVAQVKDGQVTLNFEAGTLARLGQPFATLPVIMRRRQGDVTVLDPAVLP